MLKRPWQTWTIYGLAVAVLLSVCGGLTWHAAQRELLDDERDRQRQLEDKIRLALWRMDSRLMPIIAQEAARPADAYRLVPMANDVSKHASGKQPAGTTFAPLLVQPSEFVNLNFDFGADGVLRSPQVPLNADWALSNGIAPEQLESNRGLGVQLQEVVRYDDILRQLPDEPLPSTDWLRINGSTDLRELERMEEQPSDAPTTALRGDRDLREGANTPLNRNNAYILNSAVLPDLQSATVQRQQQSLADVDQLRRSQSLQQAAQQAAFNQLPGLQETATAVAGISRPLWVQDQLILARRVVTGNETRIQGCWLDWSRLEAALIEEVRDLLPDVRLIPVIGSAPRHPARVLASLPVELDVPALPAAALGWTPLRLSLAIGWVCLLAACLAIGAVLSRIVSLSERRAAFVSAVTHELRTPLTTFRMYAEMLKDDMVPEGPQRKEYLETLHAESDRLGHLIDNVLAYSRLERRISSGHRESLSAEELLERVWDSLLLRVRQAECALVMENADALAGARVHTDPTMVEQILFNLVDNACKYGTRGGDRRIIVRPILTATQLAISVRDFGPGVPQDVQRRLFRPFSKSAEEAAATAPGVGLGLALSRGLARQLGGELTLDVAPEGAGAVFVVRIPLTRGA